MNERQREVILRVDAMVKRVMRPYHMREALFCRINTLSDDQVARLLRVVQKLTPDELDAAVGYAEGLAAWSDNEQESDDATLPTRGPETGHPAGVGPA